MPRLEESLPAVFVASAAAGASSVLIGNHAFSLGLGLAASSFGGFGNLALRMRGIMAVLENEDHELLDNTPKLSYKQRVGLFSYFYRAMAPVAVVALGSSGGAYWAASRLISPIANPSLNVLGFEATKQTLLQCASGFGLIGMPFTILFMLPTVKYLLMQADTASEDKLGSAAARQDIDNAISRWIYLNDIRLSFSLVAWTIAAYVGLS